VSKRRNKGRKPIAPKKSTEPKALQALTPGPAPAPAPVRAPKRHRGLILAAEILAVPAAVATIVGGTGYAIERWHETAAVVDFSGEPDQQKPFALPLVVKNPSSIFAMHRPQMECSNDVEYNDGGSGSLVAYGEQGATTGAAIPPGGSANYFCDVASGLEAVNKETASKLAIKQAEITVRFNYETWVPWSVNQHVATHFVMLTTTSGFRWIKGEWMSGHPGIKRPPNLESLPPTFTNEKR
jgi:hypothetical protein